MASMTRLEETLVLSLGILQECVIKASYTILKTLEHSDIVERRNMTLIDMVRCMLAYSLLPKFL